MRRNPIQCWAGRLRIFRKRRKRYGGKGIAFNRYDGLAQDEFGIWTAPGGAAKVAWFSDPDGNVLSLTQL